MFVGIIQYILKVFNYAQTSKHQEKLRNEIPRSR